MFKLAFGTAVLSTAVIAAQISPAESTSLAMLDSETSLYDFEPVDYQLVKGFSNKNTYTYTFMPGTTLSSNYFFDFATGYKLRTTVDKKDMGVTVAKAP